MMEKYADNLEELVMERTGQLIEEKKKTDALLERMLPPYVTPFYSFLASNVRSSRSAGSADPGDGRRSNVTVDSHTYFNFSLMSILLLL